MKKIADPQNRGRQFLASKLETLTGTRLAGWVLTRQPPNGKWGVATYALMKTGTNTARSNNRGPGRRSPIEEVLMTPMPPMAMEGAAETDMHLRARNL